ncbi:helix-turn-helix domain containing protein [Mycobacterium sp. CVI_P3]|uniref:Helix-turn-helix domain containing protein n=1 Tax=Mycobacterium pinniadriaticum TaxID=2994102 RepID=A0ABT3SHK9_9MYCO|nr:TetR/AcrR family transcriptional regulator [Mycobacterium pinniadriaticum]MCX2932541.1 helix-turn-helix domain containing protein [Mycobacterium pinniadriaticum]MCX2939015.1 helix-turn-helix domain containing protein [Mycobacterium pinniadriaticum]
MQPTVPAVRRRPKDRKKQILDQAARLFIDRGFHSVKLEEIAEAAGVTARALYRHYDNKQALLTAAILNAQDEYQSVRNPEGRTESAARPLHDELPELLSAAVETRALTVLWQREARYLTEDDRAEVRSRINAIVAGIQAGVRLEMPQLSPQHIELRAWAASSTLTSLGRHNLSLPATELKDVLYRACMAAAQTPPIGALEPMETPADREAASFSRYETLLAAGAQLFRARGFPAVSTADIGKRVGIAGPGLYRSFSSKQAILDTLVRRLDEWSALECIRALRTNNPAVQRLEQLVAGRVRISLENPDLVSVSITELAYASAEVRDTIVRNQADRDGVWIDLIRTLVPQTSVAQARLLVAAAVSFIEDVSRTWHLTRRTDVALEMTTIACAILTSQASTDR